MGITFDDVVAARSRWPGTLAIDCPFGWPAAFLDFLQRHREMAVQPPVDRNDLRLRITDKCVKEITGKSPLSVSTDKLGSTAIYCTELLAALDQDLSRAGSTGVIEVYPAASMKQWRMNAKTGWSDFLDALGLRSDEPNLANPHCRDSLVAAATARAFDCAATHPIPDEHREATRWSGETVTPSQ